MLARRVSVKIMIMLVFLVQISSRGNEDKFATKRKDVTNLTDSNILS